MSNVIPFPRAISGEPQSRYVVSLQRLKWMEVSEDVYDWFVHRPTKPTHVHAYGFMHVTGHAFVRIPHTDGSSVCAMSMGKLTLRKFDMLLRDDEIDAVILELGYEPSTITA